MRALLFIKFASVAQLVEQRLHTAFVNSSSLFIGTTFCIIHSACYYEELPSLRAHNSQRYIVSSNNWLVRWNLTPEMSVQVWPR